MTTFLDTVLAIQQTARAITERMDRDGPCTMRQFEALHALQAGPLTHAELAAAIGATPATLTGLVDRMEHAELVRRDPDYMNRRAVYVVPTIKGKGAYEEAVDLIRTDLYDANDWTVEEYVHFRIDLECFEPYDGPIVAVAPHGHGLVTNP